MEASECWLLGSLCLAILIVNTQADIEFLEEPYDKVVAIGQPLQFDCMARDTQRQGTFTVQWKHNNTAVSVGGRVAVYPNGTLRLSTTVSGDQGTYTCLATLVSSGGYVGQRESLTATLYFAFLNPVDLIIANRTVFDKRQDPVYFQCVSGASRPLPTISWEKDGVLVTDSIGISYGEQFGGDGSLKWSQTLQINHVRKRHEGQYRCVVTNPLLSGQVERSAYVTLTVLPNPGEPYVSIAPRSQIVPAGSPATFPCQILGDPEPNITWKRGGDPDDLVNTTNRFVLGDGSLFFESVSDVDDGSYVCTGRSTLGLVSADPVTLTAASMGWVFTQNPTDVEIVEDSVATLFCRPPVSKPAANVTWYRDNSPYVPHVSSSVLDVGDLYFSSVTKEDEGNYFCVATNDFIPQSVTSETAMLTVRVGAAIMEPPENKEVILGNDLTLTCEARGDPTPSIIWKKDSAVLSAGGRTTIGDGGQLLHIVGIIGLDQGTYMCEVTNMYGSEVASAYVDVLVSPQITTGPGNLRAGEGTSILIPCVVTIGDPVPTITWYKDNTEIVLTPGDPDYQVTNDGLTIREVRVQDGGSYKCRASNTAGSSESSVTLIVETAPVITTALLNQTVYQESVVYFTCQASGEPRPGLVWFFNDGPVPSWGSISNQGQVLTISSASGATAGKITCRAENRQGQIETEAYLLVRVAPDVTPISDRTVNVGSSFTVQCVTSAFPEPAITWLKGQDVLIPSDRITINSPNTLTIAAVTKEDQGVYSCVASNDVGSTRENFRISVLGIPSAPVILNAAAISVDSVTIYWTGSGDLTDTTHYQLQYRLSVASTWITYLDSIPALTGPPSTPQSHTLFGLDEGQTYQFRLFAKNIVGTSGSSNVMVASTPSVTGPSAPRNLVILSFNATAVTLQWEIPVERNGPIEVYTVEYRKTGTNVYSTIEIIGNDQYTIESVINNLKPVTSYQFRVAAATSHNGQQQFGDYTEYIEQTTLPSAPSAAPSNVMVTASSSTSLLVSWMAVPLEHQNGPIQGYSISYKETGGSIAPQVKTVNATGSPVSLTGLAKWQEYDIQIWGFNAEGLGPKSDILIKRTKADAPMLSPQGVDLFPTNQTAVLVTWQDVPEEYRHGAIDGYLVTYRSQDSVSGQELDILGDVNFVILTGLEVATSYYVQLVAYNLVDGDRLTGPASPETSVATQDGLPGPVQSFTASDVGPDYVYLTWEPPSVSNGVIQAYVITYKADLPQEVTTDILSVMTGGARESPRVRRAVIYSNETHGQVETTDTSYNLTSLRPETNYSIEIAPRTSAGMGVDPLKLFLSTGKARTKTTKSPPVWLVTTPPVNSQTTTNTGPVSQAPGDAAYPLNSLIIFVSAVSLAGAALCLAIIVLIVWCKRQGDDKALNKSNYLIDNDQMCSSSQRSGSDDIILDMSSRPNSKSPSTVSSRNPSRLPSISTPTPSPPVEFSDLSAMDDGPMDPSRPRASSSPSMDHRREAEAYAAYGAGPGEQGSGTVPRANGRLYTPARSPRNHKYHPSSSNLQLDSPETTPDKLDELYNKVTSSSRGHSRMKQDSLAAIAVLLDQEETHSGLQPLESPSSVVISNQRTTL